MPSVGVEWVNKYDGTGWGNLSFEHLDATGFFDELVNNAGWTGRFNWGDDMAFERDFKRMDKGGETNTWADNVDFAYFTGHGAPTGFMFGAGVPDDTIVSSDTVGNPNAGDMRAGLKELDWLALEVCSTLVLNDPQGTVFQRWRNAFQGLHMILSFTNVSGDRSDPGRTFAAFLDGHWLSVVFGVANAQILPLRVIESWWCMTMICQDAPCEAAVLLPVPDDTDVYEDYIHSAGHVSNDPVPKPGTPLPLLFLRNMC